ncbi:MAG: hypothetical protein AB7I04_18385 [Pseudomonadales bacterium]
MNRFLSIPTTFLLFAAACGGGSTTPTPTPDTPRYTAAEAKAAIYAEVKAQQVFTLGCNSETLHYRGAGIWECGDHWTFDERTGKAILIR